MAAPNARRRGRIKATWYDVLRSDPCSYCGEPGGTVDHVFPRRTGVARGVANAVGACLRCNTKKGDRSVLMFLVQRNAAKWEKWGRGRSRSGRRRRIKRGRLAAVLSLLFARWRVGEYWPEDEEVHLPLREGRD